MIVLVPGPLLQEAISNYEHFMTAGVKVCESNFKPFSMSKTQKVFKTLLEQIELSNIAP